MQVIFLRFCIRWLGGGEGVESNKILTSFFVSVIFKLVLFFES